MSICFNVKITSREILIYIVKVLYPTEKSNIISQTYIIVPPISIESQIPPKLVCCNPNQIATKISVPAPDSHLAPNELHVTSQATTFFRRLKKSKIEIVSLKYA